MILLNNLKNAILNVLLGIKNYLKKIPGKRMKLNVYQIMIPNNNLEKNALKVLDTMNKQNNVKYVIKDSVSNVILIKIFVNNVLPLIIYLTVKILVKDVINTV